MSDIEKRARELLAAEYEKAATYIDTSTEASAVRAIVAALTPPEGYVLVPVDSLRRCQCGCERHCCASCGVELGGLSARPEVP